MFHYLHSKQSSTIPHTTWVAETSIFRVRTETNKYKSIPHLLTQAVYKVNTPASRDSGKKTDIKKDQSLQTLRFYFHISTPTLPFSYFLIPLSLALDSATNFR
jgi:hypothetical protein